MAMIVIVAQWLMELTGSTFFRMAQKLRREQE
jgi:hypothetical protein